MRGVLVGIDIGTTAVTTAVARSDKSGKFRIVAASSAPNAGVRRGMVVDVEAAAGALKRSIHEASRAAGGTIKNAYLAVGGAHLNAFMVRGAIAVSRADGEVTEDDVRRVIGAAEGMIPRNPNREVIHVIPRSFKVDGEGGIADPIGLAGMKLEVEALVVDGAKSALANLIKCCEQVGVAIDDWVASPLAAAEVLLSKKQRELGAILLDLGAGTSDFAVFEEGRVVDVGSFPIGGSHITADIAIGFRTPVAAAEAIKVRHATIFPESVAGKRETIRLTEFGGGSKDEFLVRDLADIVGARLTDIFELTTKALKKIGRAGLLPGGVVLSGGVADIPGIVELARRELRLPVELAKAAAVDPFGEVIPPRLAVPVGLILWQLEARGDAGGSRRGGWRGAMEELKRMLRGMIP